MEIRHFWKVTHPSKAGARVVGGANGSLHEPSLTVSTQSSVVVTPILTAFVIVLVMQNYNLWQGGHVWHVSAQAVEDILGLTYFPVGSPLSLPRFPKLCQYCLGRLHECDRDTLWAIAESL